MYPALRPDQVAVVVQGDYAAYMNGLYRAWSAARHPDVNGTGHPVGRNLVSEERAEEMRNRLGEVADLLDAEAWHDDCYSPRSSQALLVEILGNLMMADALELVTGAVSEVRPQQIQFEEVCGRTNFDAIIRGVAGEVIATVESKFTEPGFNTCGYPLERCDGTWWSRPNTRLGCPMADPTPNRAIAGRYWTVAQEDWNVPQEPPGEPTPCPLWASYQAAHNLAETRRLSGTAHWLLLYDERNPYFAHERVGWVPRLKRTETRGWHAMSWQQLLRRAVEHVPELRRLQTLHGL